MTNYVAVEIVGTLTTHVKPHFQNLHGVNWILKKMAAKADPDRGIEEVKVEVKADEHGYLYDIRLNNMSLGYKALEIFVKEFDDLKLPKISKRLKSNDLWDNVSDHLYFISYFGDEFISKYGE